MKPSVLLRKGNDTPDRGRMQVFCGGISPFSAKFFPGREYKKSAGGNFPLRAPVRVSAAAAVVAAAVVIAAAVVAAPAAAAEQNDDENDDPQAAIAAPAVVIAAPHDEYLLNYESIKRAVCRSQSYHMA